MQRPNKLLAILLVILLAAGLFSLPANAASTVDQTIKVELDNKPISFDVSPTIEKGRTLVPLRAIFEALGALVKWEQKTKTVTAVKGNTTVKLSIGSKTAYKNNEEITLDVPAKIINGRTLVPLRFISESLGYKVKWDATSRLVSISSGGIIKKIAEKIAGAVEKVVKPKATEEVAEKPKEELKEKPRSRGGGGGGGGSSRSGKTLEGKYPRTIVDSTGKTVTIQKPPERIVACGRNFLEMLRALKVEKERIAGVETIAQLSGRDNNRGINYKVFFPEYQDKPTVGSLFSPDVEAILNLHPDLVFLYPSVGYGGNKDPIVAANALEAAGIPVVRLYCGASRGALFLTEDAEKLGYILDKEKEAREFINWYEEIMDLIEKRVRTIPEGDKPKVYAEGYKKYYSTGERGSHIEKVGGKNIFAKEHERCDSSLQIDPGAVIKRDPDIIIKQIIGGGGYHLNRSNTAKLKEIREEIMKRPELQDVKAVKEGRVYVISDYLLSYMPGFGMRSFIQDIYMAKWLHPELFKDIDPRAFHQEYLSRFQGLNIDLSKKGVFVYPEQ